MADLAIQLIANGETLDMIFPNPVRFQSDGWSPSIAALVEGIIGPPGVHGDVDETFTLNISGSGSISTMNQALLQLTRMLRTADAQGKKQQPPYGMFKVQLQGSSNAPWYMVITKVKSDGGRLYQLPASYLKKVHAAEIEGATITFTRRGPLVGDTPDVVTSATNATIAPKVVTFSSSASEYSPLQAEIKTTVPTGQDMIGATVLVGRSADDFHVATGAALVNTGQSQWPIVAGTSSSKGAIARGSFPAGTGAATTALVSTPQFATADKVAFWLTTRLNQAAPCLLSITIVDALGQYSTIPYLITAQDTTVVGGTQIDALPTISLPNGMTGYRIHIDGTSLGAGTLDVAHVIALRQDDATCRSFTANSGAEARNLAATNSIGIYRTCNWMLEPTGVQYLTGTAATLKGDIPFDGRTDLVSIGTTAALLRIVLDGGDSDLWQASSWQWTARRWPTTLVPV